MGHNRLATPAAELAPRKLPTQQRAKARVERILGATAALLDEVGIDGLTTNLVAERAEVQVASLYQYFPNKYALLTELARRMVEEQARQLDPFMTEAGFTHPWPDVIDGIFDVLVADTDAQAGAAAIRLALAAVPELAEVRDWERRTVVERLVAALRGEGARGSDAQVHAVALVLFTTATAVVNEVMQSPPEQAAALVAEVKRLHHGYLRAVLSADGGSAGD